jgi:hypothetical protein
LLAALDGRLEGHDRAEDSLMLYTSNAEELLAEIDQRRFPHESAHVRHATLEDVFLRLTGRSLRE